MSFSNSAHLLFDRTTVPGADNIGHALPMSFLSILAQCWPSFPAGFGEILAENSTFPPAGHGAWITLYGTTLGGHKPIVGSAHFNLGYSRPLLMHFRGVHVQRYARLGRRGLRGGAVKFHPVLVKF